MQSPELFFEVSAQELVDPRTAATEAIEFDDLDTVLNPVLPAANEPAPEAADSDAEVEIELELTADAIDELLGTSVKMKA